MEEGLRGRKVYFGVMGLGKDEEGGFFVIDEKAIWGEVLRRDEWGIECGYGGYGGFELREVKGEFEVLEEEGMVEFV